MIDSYGLSDVGCTRATNEDSYALAPELGLFVVADGMGGAQAGEQASAIATETIVGWMRRAAPRRTTQDLLDAIREANRIILEEAAANPDFQGMGTTVVAALVDLPVVHIASVGDSRVYLWRNGVLERITSDQTWVNEVGRSLGLTEEQIHVHPFRNVLTMAVGARERIEVHSHELEFDPGDLLLLCSDGLHGVIDETSLAEALSAGTDLAGRASALIEMARERGGPDNITVVLVENRP